MVPRREERTMTARRAPLLVCIWSALLLLPGLQGPLYRNEGLRARMAAELLQSGDWLVPTLYGEPHLTKPPGMTLAIVLCSLPAGTVTPMTARLPSVLAGAAIVAMWFAAFRRAAGERAALVIGLIMPACLLWLDRVPSA